MTKRLTPDDIGALRDIAADISKPINEWMVQDIARRVAKAGAITSTAEYQLYRAQGLGAIKKDLAAAVARQMHASEDAVFALFGDVADKSTSLQANGVLRQLAAAYGNMAARATRKNLENLWVPGPEGEAYTAQDAYNKCMDFAFGKVFTGAADYNTAIRQATKELAARGVYTIARKNGSLVGIESATRSYITNRMAEMYKEIAQFNFDKMGADGWEISAHGGCAPDHEHCQGRQYSEKDYKVLNDGMTREIGQFLCRHIPYPIVMGESKPNYTGAQLRRMQEDNARGVTYGGKHYTLYEAEQERASIENAMRRQKRQCLELEALGQKSELQARQIGLNRLNEEYVRFCKATGQRTRSERVATAGFGRKQAAQMRAAVQKSRQELVLQKLNFIDDVPKQQREAIEKELALLPKHIRAIAELHIKGIRVTSDKSGSFYNPKTKEISVSEFRQDGAVIHEYAHGLERALHLYSDPAFLEIRDKGLEKLTANDILIDTDTFTDTVLLIQSDKFVSAYQGRIYGEYLQHGANGKVSLDGMREYFSEGLRAFYFETDLLKQRDPALYTFIEELVK